MAKKNSKGLSMASAGFCSIYGLLIMTALTLGASIQNGANYDGYQVLEVTPHTEESADDLMRFLTTTQFEILVASKGPNDAAIVMVSPEKATLWSEYLQDHRSNTIKVMINNVGKFTQSEDEELPVDDDDDEDDTAQDLGPFGWKSYHHLRSIQNWLKFQSIRKSEIATLVGAGNTSEGRELMGLRIAHKPNLPIVFVMAGIHGREWIGPPTAAWFIKDVLKGTDETLKAYEWHVFPVVNPDGYYYTQMYRNWRKNIHNYTPDSSCFGVDLNRNWPFKWRERRKPCSGSYPGPYPSSEGEVQGLIAYLSNILGRTRVFISLRSYGQLLTYPWGYTSNATRDDARFSRIARRAYVESLGVYGREYQYGRMSKVLNQRVRGSPIDYAYSVNISYPFELWLRDKSTHRLPRKYIRPTAVEALKALTAILQEAL